MLPEHTLEAYAEALAQRADVIEPDLVACRGGELVARHDLGLLRSTDVAGRVEFARRKRDDDWWLLDFSATDVRRLRARQCFPGRSDAHDGRFGVPTFGEVLAWAGTQAPAAGLTLYPELKHPAWHARAGVDVAESFVEALAHAPANVAVWLQCFESEPLRRIEARCGLPVYLLLGPGEDWRAALEADGAWLAGFGVHKQLLGAGNDGDSGLVAAAHALGLQVHAWTFRDDSVAEPFASITAELEWALALGVDALFCDFPATAVAVRERWAAAHGLA